MSTDKHLQMLDVIADLDQLEFAELQKWNKVGKFIDFICPKVHWHSDSEGRAFRVFTWYPLELILVRFMTKLCWFLSTEAHMCAVCLFAKYERIIQISSVLFWKCH